MSMSLEIRADGTFAFKVRGGKLQKEETFAVRGPGFEPIGQRAAEILARWPELKELNVSAEPTVKHGDVVKAINELQKQTLKVYLAS